MHGSAIPQPRAACHHVRCVGVPAPSLSSMSSSPTSSNSYTRSVRGRSERRGASCRCSIAGAGSFAARPAPGAGSRPSRSTAPSIRSCRGGGESCQCRHATHRERDWPAPAQERRTGTYFRRPASFSSTVRVSGPASHSVSDCPCASIDAGVHSPSGIHLNTGMGVLGACTHLARRRGRVR